jgi:hypothetical protein
MKTSSVLFGLLALASWSGSIFVIGATSRIGCENTTGCPVEEATEPEWDCERIVGCATCDTKVFKCHDPSTDTCYLVSSGGGILEVACLVHPIAEENPYE